MDKPTILFIAFNAHGHINPLLGVANQVKEDTGYRTIFLLSEPALDSNIKKHGHEVVTFKPVEIKNSKETISQKFANLNGGKQSILDPVDNFIKSYDKIVNICFTLSVNNNDSYAIEIEKIKPDLMVIDGAILIPYVYSSGRPWVKLYSSNPIIFCCSRLPGGEMVPPMIGCSLLKGKAAREKMRTEDPAGWQALIAKWNADYKKIRDAKIGYLSEFQRPFITSGLRHFDMFERNYDSPYLNIFQFPRELDYDLEDDIFAYPPGFIGFDALTSNSLDEQNPEKARIWSEKLAKGKEGKSAIVYFSLGTMASADLKLMNRFINILKDDKKRLYVISKGEFGDQIELCEDNMIGANYLPQTLILRHADLAIIHGGNNSLIECVQRSVPMILLPVFADQLDNAQRVEDLEIGRRLDINDCTREQLLITIDELLSNSRLLEKIKRLGERVRARDDPHKVPLVLKKLIKEGYLEQSFLEDCRERTAKEVEILCNQTITSNSN